MCIIYIHNVRCVCVCVCVCVCACVPVLLGAEVEVAHDDGDLHAGDEQDREDDCEEAKHIVEPVLPPP